MAMSSDKWGHHGPRRAAFAAVCAGVLALAACASDEAVDNFSAQSAERGRIYAQDRCASCHGVSPGAASRNSAAPTFEALANRPDMSRFALTVLLQQPHRDMPNLMVAREDVADLAAYLETLRQ